MADFAGILVDSVVFTLRSWLAVLIVLLFRVALAIAGFLPVFLLLMILVRAFLAAPVDPVTGMTDPLIWWDAVRANPLILLAYSGVFACLMALRFVMVTFLDAGLVGGMVDGIRAKRGMRLGEFLSGCVRLFDRVLLFRGLAELFSLVLSLGVLAVLAVVLWLGGRAGDPFESLLPYAVYLVSALLGLWILGNALIFLFYLVSICSASVDETSAGAALVDSTAFLTQNFTKVLVMTTFFGVLAFFWSVLRVGGGFWFLWVSWRYSGGSLLKAAMNAWDLTFAILALLAWVMLMTTTLLLYIRFRAESDGVSPQETA